MSKVVGCKLEQQSLELNFNFYKGSCQTFRLVFSNLNCFLIGWISDRNLNRSFWKSFKCTYPKSSAVFRLLRQSRLSYVSWPLTHLLKGLNLGHIDSWPLLELSCSFDGTGFGTAGSSKVSHRETLGLANYRGDALTTGCSTGGSCGVRTEACFQKIF